MTRDTSNQPVSKFCYWENDHGSYLYTALHVPSDRQCRTTGIVICNSLGHEHVHAYRSLRALADALASRGFAVIRFDYEGTGNSSGGVESPAIESRWLNNIFHQGEALRDKAGVQDICLIGFRIGALFAAAAATRLGCRQLVLWAPYRDATKYARELRALSKLSDYPQPSEDRLECGGFTYRSQLLHDISAIENKVDYRESDLRILHIHPNTVKQNDPCDRYQTVCHIRQPSHEYEAMLAEPHLTEIPETTIAEISDWMSETTSSDSQAIDIPVERLKVHQPQSQEKSISETIVWEPNASLSGVLCQPHSGHSDNQILVVLPNAGSVNCMGPSRVYVELARALAAKGVTSFRFDLPNLGESVIGHTKNENHPYPDSAVSTLQSVFAFASENWGIKNFIIAGLCSGSYTAFRYAVETRDKRINELIMINPLTFEWHEGMPLRLGSGQVALNDAKYYEHAIRDPGKWKRFFTGKVNYYEIACFSFSHIVRSMTTFSAYILDSLSVTRPTKLARKLRSITDSGIRLTFFFSSRDPGYELLKSESLSTERQLRKMGKLMTYFIENADHTFSQSIERDDFLRQFTEHIERTIDKNSRN